MKDETEAALITKLWDEIPRGELASRLGITSSVLRARGRGLGLHTVVQSPVWSEDSTERLSHLWSLGVPTSDIAAQLKTTRNAVIGKANRLGLESRDYSEWRVLGGRNSSLVQAIRKRRALRLRQSA